MRTLVIVYQAGIANVFEDRRRLLQADFRACEIFCRGAHAMGAHIVPAWFCDHCGKRIESAYAEDKAE